ncbi:MFS transporter [Lederbergia citrea]|uniref:MFS transporter n=1 Tax=Lederbergia citrea TaxID=2833581 RepID=A0A942UTW8_9BACI|nr:MFS transporter [Lederbergia citrea]MBS4205888.1 MFS transporter [Lederbergia citrea]MBS4224663.1 MFS transporter [Lederbergia citrea]
MNKQPLWTKNFLGVSMSSFFLFLAFYLLIVTLPIYTMDQLGGNAAEIGLVVTIFLIGAVIIRPLSGIWIERMGRRKMLAIALAIVLVSTFFYIFSHSLTPLLFLRFFHGIGFGMATTATGTIVADLVPESRRGEGMGYYATFMNLAMVIGPFLGLTLVQFTSFTNMFIVCTLLSVLAIISVVFISIPKIHPGELVSKTFFSFKNLFEKSALPISIVGGMLAIAYAGILSFVSVYAKELDLLTAASYFFVVYAVFLLASRPFTGRWFDQYGENFIIYPAILSSAIGLMILSQSTSTFTFLLSGVFIGIGFGTLTPALQTIAIRGASPTSRGMATATFFTFYDAGIGLGSYLLGITAISLGYANLYLLLSFFIIGCLGLYFVLHGRFQNQKKQKEELQHEIHVQ